MEQKKEKEVKDMYDILLIVPGMEDLVSLNAKVQRKFVLLLVQLVHEALIREGQGNGSMSGVLSKETLQELKNIVDDFLVKAGLVELNEKVSRFRN